VGSRLLHDLGETRSRRPRDIQVVYSKGS
jgi:hypothetical protein